MRVWGLLGLLGLLVSAQSARAGGLVNPTVVGNELTAGIDLPGGITGQLRISFEEVDGLSVESLGLSVDLVSPLDPSLLARLPSATLNSIPSAFPILVRLDPPVDGPLSFRGMPSIEIYTTLLDYIPGSTLRLFAAPSGGTFADVSHILDSGSFRVVGRKPETAGDYMPILDLRPIEQVVIDKIYWLENLLAANSHLIDPLVYNELTTLTAAIRSNIEGGSTETALNDTLGFLEEVEAHSGEEIPDLWVASRELTNVAGDLRAVASTLELSLQQQSALEP